MSPEGADPAAGLARIAVRLDGTSLTFEQARELAECAARAGTADPESVMLISWCDRRRQVHSPQCLKCTLHDRPAWEVYGATHGGRVRVSVDDDEYVFIFS